MVVSKADLDSLLKSYNQEHLLQYWDELDPQQKADLNKELLRVDFDEVERLFKDATKDMNSTQAKKDDFMEEIPEEIVGKISKVTEETKTKWWDTGLNEIAENHVGVLLLAGGQGTRLGVNYPKGMYDVGLPSNKTLYQLQAERILRLQNIAQKKYGKDCKIRWYIMTSEATLKATKDYFNFHSHFGLDSNNIIYFEQHLLPCLTLGGKLILSSKGSLALAPDGNGGLYKAIKSAKIIEDMDSHGIKHIFVYCVDNILVKVADPIFIGFCIDKNADCANKVIEKIDPTESVGVVCKCKGKYQVVEYSEISSSTAEKRNKDGSLAFKDSNICLHYFTLDFLKKVIGEHLNELPHHVAKKKIPFVNANGENIKPTEPNGIKLEKFVFDVFQFSSNFAVFEGERQEEFSPLKNAPSNPKCSPVSCKQDVSDLHRTYLKNAGVKFVNRNGISTKESDTICEISPLISFSGEGLEDYSERSYGFGEVVHITDGSERVSPDPKRQK